VTAPAAVPASAARGTAVATTSAGSPAGMPAPRGAVTVPVVAPAPLRDLVRGRERPVAVVAAFPRAVYLEVEPAARVATGAEPCMLALVTADGVGHPNALVLTVPAIERPLAGLHRGVVGTVGHGELTIGRHRFRARRWRQTRPVLAACSPETLVAAAGRLRQRLATSAPLSPDLAAPLARVVGALLDEPEAAMTAARELIGRGPGLTPAGDDLLAGLLAGAHALGPAIAPADVASLLTTATHRFGESVVAASVGRTTDVSVALLRHATSGEVAEPAAHLLRALTAGGGLDAATERLLAVGSTSGRDLAFGLLAASELVLTAAGASRTAPPA
jgi:hypothetical protein